MKKVRMKTISAGPGGCYHPGQVIAIDDVVATALVAGGFAEYIDEPPVIESAAIEPPEKAVLPAAKRKAVK